ncbi:MAG TPA: DUF423 domain-containing protein [Rhizomicrobium sp.]|nr:DUF423 domain-containing protein [Rhizomicrobium sp.]
MRNWLFLASITGALGVILAAFGEHALAARLAPAALAAFATAARYQLIHALAMGLAALAARGAAKVLAERAALLFLAGILLFSGSLYGLALTGLHVLGFVTPLGGLALIAGWIVLALAALKWEDR